MTNIIGKAKHLKESKPTPHEQDELSPNTEEYTYGNNITASQCDDAGIDMQALDSIIYKYKANLAGKKGKKLSRSEKKQAKKLIKQKAKRSRKKYVSVKSQLKDRDKELSDKNIEFRKKRNTAKNVLNYIGYNAMYQDGICEVEEGLFSASISFEDTSYHSVREEQQKAMFSGLARLYDQFGANTLVQMSVINTPLLKEEVGNRCFFQPEKQNLSLIHI